MNEMKFEYNTLEKFCNKAIMIIAVCVIIFVVLGFSGNVPLEIINPINIFLLALVNILNGIVFKRKNIKVSVILFVTGFVLITILVIGAAMNLLGI